MRESGVKYIWMVGMAMIYGASYVYMRPSQPCFFDNPFPSLLYQRVVDTAMLIWEDIQVYNAGRSGLDRQTWHDLLMGRLIRLSGYCKKLANNKISLVLKAEDRLYLLVIMEKVALEYKDGRKKIIDLIKMNMLTIHKL
jgi:hypothetical protein